MILTYERLTHFPTRTGNVRLCVDEDGAVYVQKNRAEPPRGQAWSGDFPAEPVARLDHARARIAAILDRHRFASFPDQIDADLDDSYEEVLTVWPEAGPPRTVVAEGGRPPLLGLIAELINLLGVTDHLA